MCYNTCPKWNGYACTFTPTEEHPVHPCVAEATAPKWPPYSEEYGAYKACDSCPCQDDYAANCQLFCPRTHCERKAEIMAEVYPGEPFTI